MELGWKSINCPLIDFLSQSISWDLEMSICKVEKICIFEVSKTLSQLPSCAEIYLNWLQQLQLYKHRRLTRRIVIFFSLMVPEILGCDEYFRGEPCGNKIIRRVAKSEQ